MIKIIALLISLGLSFITTYKIDANGVFNNTIIYIAFFLVYVICIVALFFVSALALSIGIDKNKKRDTYSKAYHKIYTFYDGIVLKTFGVKLKVEGMDKLPKDTNFLVVQNHVSNVDPLALNYALKKNELIFVSKASLFNIPFFGKMIQKIGYVKLYRNNSREDALEMIRGTKFLENGYCSMAIYPEGSRNKNYKENKLQEFRPGAFSPATKNKLPIVFTSISGTEKINDGLIIKPHKVVIKVVRVLNYDDYKEMNTKEISELAYKEIYDSFEYCIK